MRIRFALVAVIGGLIAMTQAAQAYDPEWRSTPPVTYVLDYGQGHISNPDYIASVAGSPPTILHLGKDLVMSHNWGPIQGVGGENVAGGRGDAIRRLSPAETWERYHALEEMVDNLHAAGVKYVMPYICSVTVGGHHVRRTGFWEFYDHWDEYLEFGLPPRPELDPADWVQRLPDGTMKPTYGSKPDVDEFYPGYEPNLRYAMCVNNPGWRTWLDAVVRLVAEVGYDGAFVDNGSTQQCYCRFCEEKYQGFLRSRYTDAQIRELFDADPREAVPLTVPPAGGEPPTLGWVESQRFWRESIYDHQQAIKRAGEEVNDRFILFPNGGHNRPETVKQSYRDTDYVMYELSAGDYGTNPGLVRAQIVDDIFMNVRNNNIWEYKYTQATREGVSALILTRGGYPSEKPAWVLNDYTAALGNAEAAAFGSGSGFLLRPRWDMYEGVLNTYRRFFEENAGLYTGLVPYAQVGLAAFGEQTFYSNRAHTAAVEQLVDELTAQHVLFDLLTEEAFTPENLARFDTVILPNVDYVTPWQLAALAAYADAGGRVIVIGGLPEQDMQLRPLDAPGLGTGCVELDTIPLGQLMALLRGDGRELDVAAGAGEGVRLNSFIAPDESRITLHVLNYDAPLGSEPPELVAKENLALSVPLPDGAAVTAVVAYSPDWPTQDLPYQVADGRLQVTLPALRIYSVLQIGLQ